jgi:hypothetical protein
MPSFLRNDPDRALEVLCRGLVIAQDSGNRFTESMLGPSLSRLQPEHEPAGGARLRHSGHPQPPRRGNTTTIRVPFAVLVTPVDPRERYESAVTIAGFAFRPHTAATFPELSTTITHHRDVLARKGETMTTAEIVTYASTKSTRPEQNWTSRKWDRLGYQGSRVGGRRGWGQVLGSGGI